MRPKERLLRRGIPNDAPSIRKALEVWSDGLSNWEHFFTAVVVLGLIVEYLPEITYFLGAYLSALVQPHAQQLRELGGLLVIIGVAGELWIGNRSGRVETDLRDETNLLISDANERAARAEQVAAEANLARARTEERILQLSQGRQFSPDLQDDLIELLKPFAGNSVDVFLFDEHSIEASILADRIRSTFAGAGWKQKLWHCTSGRSCTGSLSIALASDLFVRQGPISGLQMLMIDLQHKVHEVGTEMIALATGFDRKKPIQPWEMKEHASWKAEESAPLRIEVAAMQYVPFVSQIPRPVTPL